MKRYVRSHGLSRLTEASDRLLTLFWAKQASHTQSALQGNRCFLSGLADAEAALPGAIEEPFQNLWPVQRVCCMIARHLVQYSRIDRLIPDPWRTFLFPYLAVVSGCQIVACRKIRAYIGCLS